jgi:hypothetical protein
VFCGASIRWIFFFVFEVRKQSHILPLAAGRIQIAGFVLNLTTEQQRLMRQSLGSLPALPDANSVLVRAHSHTRQSRVQSLHYYCMRCALALTLRLEVICDIVVEWA